jgi:hypothetical protein
MESFAKLIINDWQKQKNSTNENVDTLKTKFKNELEQKIQTINNEFVKKLDKLKKNDDQISNLVYDLFMELKSRLQTNDIYYVNKSIETFKNNIDENNIFLRLNDKFINQASSVKVDFKDIECYFQIIDYQIPETLTQKDEKKKGFVRKRVDQFLNKFKGKNTQDENTEEHNDKEKALCKSSFIELYHLLYSQDRG